MNSIIWKGVSSTTIKGLLISELPPITKPKMRTKETEVDGRDGSTIEELGYETYTKTVKIGLYGNFDIDQVIKYFTGEGDIVFSNEPNKVYKAKICGKIDYTRLLRYRKASIPFVVQPFKYKLNEYLRETPTETASGNSINLTDSYKITNLKTYGYTKQEGTPSPSAPIDVDVAKGSVKVKTTGKNILNYAKNFKPSFKGLTSVLNADGSITITGKVTENYTSISQLSLDDLLISGKTYTISQKNSNKVFLQINITDKATNKTQYIIGKGSFVADLVNYKYIANIQTSTVESFGAESIKETNFYQIEEGAKATDFEPYKESIVTYAIGDEFMAEQDYIENGTLVKNTKKIVLNGSETINLEANSEYTRFYLSDIAEVKTIRNREPIISTHFAYSSALHDVGTGFTHDGKIYLYPPTDITTVVAFREWLSLNQPEIYFQRENAERISLGENPQTFETNTVITNSNNTLMKVEYIKPFEVFNEGLENSKPLMILKGSGTVEISVNGVGIFSYTFPDGENEVYIDSEKEDAYLGNVLKNRNMNGEFPVLIPKTNKIEWSGDIESISVLPRSRWL